MKSIISGKFLLGAVSLACVSALSAADAEKGFTPLFNGKDLTGWKGNTTLWSVKDGAITGKTTVEQPAKGNTFLIWTGGDVSDFELRAEFKITPDGAKGFANSGIQYRSKVLDEEKWVVGGYQADMEAGPTYSGILYDEAGVAGKRQIMAMRGEKVTWTADCKKEVTGAVGKSDEIQEAIKKNDWNEYTIIAKGNHLQHFINGKATVDVTDDCSAKASKSGVLALQLHAGDPMTVQFRNIRIKNASGDSASSADEMKKFEGVWEAIGGEVNGAAMPSENVAGLMLTVTGNKYSVVKGDFNDHGTFSADGSKSPKQMDVWPETGGGAGTKVLAIYEVGPENIRACYTTDGGERPKAFTTEVDSGRVIFTYKRKKP